MKTLTMLALVLPAALLGCKDKAQPAYARCVQADGAGDLSAAWAACNAAVMDDPNSTSGKAAAAKLAEMKPRYDAWKADQDAKAAAIAAARAKADLEGRAQAAAAARAKVRGKYDGFDSDPTCTAKGLPPFRKDYTGGTLAEDQMVAAAEGCSPLFPGRSDPLLAVTFCCPR